MGAAAKLNESLSALQVIQPLNESEEDHVVAGFLANEIFRRLLQSRTSRSPAWALDRYRLTCTRRTSTSVDLKPLCAPPSPPL